MCPVHQIILEGFLKDTEDWNNDAENSALHHRNKLHFKMYKTDILNCNIFSQYYYLFIK